MKNDRYNFRKPISEGLRQKILDRDNHSCVYCLDEAECIDHIIPVSHIGGRRANTENNLVSACEICNLIASDKVFGNFGEKRQYILETRSTSKKWRRRILDKHRIPICVNCNEPFTPLRGIATNFLCEACAYLYCETRGKKSYDKYILQSER